MEPDSMPEQQVIDLETGEDITAVYVTQRLQELRVIGDSIIEAALALSRENPKEAKEIYYRSYRELYYSIGHGSIGPATAAAGPLLDSLYESLTNKLDMSITEKEIAEKKLSE